MLLSNLKTPNQGILLIELGPTSHYAENFISFLYNTDYHLAVINPIQTATLRKLNTHKTKIYKIDTILIIKPMILSNHRIFHQADINQIRPKGLCCFREKTKKV